MTQHKARITGLSAYLPEKVLTNFDLEKMVETSDEWISTRTGIKERRIAAENEATSDLGAKAAKILLKKFDIDPETIDLILVATTSPDYICPSVAVLIQSHIKATNAACMDLAAACTGFIYGISMAKAYVESKLYQRVLLIAAEKMSSVVDYQDRNTCVLFGDGACAALIEGEGHGLAIESVRLGSDGDKANLIMIEAGGSKRPACQDTVDKRQHYIKMTGQEVFKNAVRRMAASTQECLQQSHLSEHDIQWLVPHQANLRIIDALGKTFSIDNSKIYRTVHKYGNTSASSVGIALSELVDEHPPKKGEIILLTAFGAGLTWGSAILKKL